MRLPKLVLAVAVAACGGDRSPSPAAAPPASPTAEQPPTPPGPASANQHTAGTPAPTPRGYFELPAEPDMPIAYSKLDHGPLDQSPRHSEAQRALFRGYLAWVSQTHPSFVGTEHRDWAVEVGLYHRGAPHLVYVSSWSWNGGANTWWPGRWLAIQGRTAEFLVAVGRTEGTAQFVNSILRCPTTLAPAAAAILVDATTPWLPQCKPLALPPRTGIKTNVWLARLLAGIALGEPMPGDYEPPTDPLGPVEWVGKRVRPRASRERKTGANVLGRGQRELLELTLTRGDKLELRIDTLARFVGK